MDKTPNCGFNEFHCYSKAADRGESLSIVNLENARARKPVTTGTWSTLEVQAQSDHQAELELTQNAHRKPATKHQKKTGPSGNLKLPESRSVASAIEYCILLA